MCEQNDNIDVLYKISPEEYIKDILAGRLYMKPLSYYRSLEIDGKGDDKEGVLCDKGKGEIFVELDGKQELLGTASNISAWVNSNNPVFCFSHATLKCTEDGIYRLNISSRMISEFVTTESKSFGLIIIERRAFEQRLTDVLTAQDYKFKEVVYTDTIGFNNDPAFHKRCSFSHQKEIRLLLPNIKLGEDEHCILRLGNIDAMCKGILLPHDIHNKPLTLNIHPTRP